MSVAEKYTSVAETNKREQHMMEAEKHYRRLSEKGRFERLRHEVGLAKQANLRAFWDNAIQHSTNALALLKKYFPRRDSNSDYTSLAILKSMRFALSKHGEASLQMNTEKEIDQIQRV